MSRARKLPIKLKRLRRLGIRSESYSKRQLRGFGFLNIGENVFVAKNTKFYDFSGSIGDGSRIDSFCIFTGKVQIGSQVHVAPYCFFGGTGGLIELKNKSGIAAHSVLFTKSFDISYASQETKIEGPIEIGESCLIGHGCTIMPNVVVGDHTTVSAMSVIDKSVGKFRVVKSFGSRVVISQRDPD